MASWTFLFSPYAGLVKVNCPEGAGTATGPGSSSLSSVRVKALLNELVEGTPCLVKK